MGGKPVSMCVMDFGFIGGSMGAVVGEKVARAGEAALAERIPLIIVSSSGGARMQEGTYSLMQLVKTMSVVERVRAARVPFISVLTDPTTGGVFASFAVVGDVNIAEPNALIRFAGDRVSSGTIGEELPPGYAARRVLVQPRLRGPDRHPRQSARRDHRPARVPGRSAGERLRRAARGARSQAALVPLGPDRGARRRERRRFTQRRGQRVSRGGAPWLTDFWAAATPRKAGRTT